ncbi:MAG: TldD/PmbA family protein [Chloroflexi bacterium]|nr:TldD/PmbA family protein [Chloroflexota bacterium]
MRDRIEEALRGHNADYIELRIEEIEGTHLSFRNTELEDIGRSRSLGGCARALVKGGWGFVSFTSLEGLREKVALAVSQARMVGGKRLKLAAGPLIDEEVPPTLPKDPRTVPLAEKVALLREYTDALWSVPHIQSTGLAYGDRYRRVIFANGEGSYIVQARVDVNFRPWAAARDGGDVQQYGVSLGSLGDYGLVEGKHKEVRGVAEKAVELLSAPRLHGGEYVVICDPILAGVFAHEAFGHLSESDFVYENERVQELMVLGRRFGGPHLNIVDGAAIPGLRGSYKYDDEGMPATRTDLIREGVLVGRLHSRETAAKMQEPPTGNARAIDFHFHPIVRMTNTFIEPGTASVEDIFAEVKDGVYAKNWYGGMTSMEMFTFSAGEAYRIRNGRVAELLRPVVLSGNVFTTLENVDAVANDLDFNQGGGCGKGGQAPLPVSNGSPHIRIRSCLVGGA